jgi:hypothetical protein
MSENSNTNTNVEPASSDGASPPVGSWFDSLPDEVKSNETLSVFKEAKGVEDVLTAYTALEGKLKGAIAVPGENATDEERSAFRDAIRKATGVPETADGYKLSLPNGVPKGDPVLERFIAASHESGLNEAQVQGIMNRVVESLSEYREAQKLVAKEAMQKEWGEQFDAKVALAIKGLEGSGSDAGMSNEEVAALAEALPTNQALVKMFSVIGKYYSEDRFISGSGNKLTEPRRTLSGHPILKYEDGFGVK